MPAPRVRYRKLNDTMHDRSNPMRFRSLAPLVLSALVASCTHEQLAPVDAWAPRHDEVDATSPSERFSRLDDGIEAKPGPNATLWNGARGATAEYRFAARITHLDSGLHPHGAGLAFGGTDVHGDDQCYTYFLVRGDRLFLIKTRTGDQTTEVAPWTEHEALSPEDDKFVTENELAVEVGTDESRFLVNGQEVFRAPNAKLHTQGLCGFRLVHDIHVRFDRMTIEPR